MEILFLAPQPFYSPRGSPIAEANLLRVLSERGHRIDVLTYAEGSDLTIPGVRIVRVARLPGVSHLRPGFSLKKVICDVQLLFGALRLVRRKRYDVVHAVEESVFVALLLQAIGGLPYVYDMDSRLSEQMLERFPMLRAVRGAMEYAEEAAAARSLGVVAVCESLRAWARDAAPDAVVARLEDMSQLEAAKSDATELDSATAGPPPAPGRGDDRGTRALYVGNLEPYQGIDLMLDAFRLATERAPDLRLDVVGGLNGDREHYEGMASRLGLEGRVRFLGPRPVSELGAWLRGADILLSPRVAGSNTPMKIYSYLDSGVPVVATRLLSHLQVLDDDVAVLVEPRPEAFAEGLLALAEDPTLRRDLGRRAKTRAQREFSPDAFRRKASAFYAEVEAAVAAGR